MTAPDAAPRPVYSGLMRLLLGPPGSGKTTRVLKEFLRAASEERVRLVVPTSTMAEHLRHELARRGHPVRPSRIVTMAGLVGELAPDVRMADAASLALLVELALDRRPDLYKGLRGSPGLAASLASAFEELAHSGCDALQLESLARLQGHVERDFRELYRELESELSRAGLHLRASALFEAAGRVARNGAPFSRVWFDGFFLFSAAERRLIGALKQAAEVAVTLPEWEGAQPSVEAFRELGAGVERLSPARPRPEVVLVHAASREHEAEEIALQILDEHSRGRPWREMGVVIRAEREYVSLLERTFFRAGIPARSYFGRSVWHEPAGLLARRFVDAVGSGWDGEAALRLLRSPGCRVAGSVSAGGVWARAVEELPFSGLERLERAAGAAVAGILRPFADWPGLSLSPPEWARRFAEVARLLEPPPADRALGEPEMRDFRLRAACFREILNVLEGVARLLPEDPLPLAEFWSAAEPALRESRVFPHDARRDVVHILDVQESRQWELPVVFVCGLLEGEFPRRAAPDPVLPDSLRSMLAESRLDIRTRAAREAEERFLYEVARTRASQRLFLSWPARNEKGDENVRSFVLDQEEAEGARTIPARRFSVRPRRAAGKPPRPALQSDEVLRQVRDIHSRIAATAIESFLQCPFQFFARWTLRLKELPPLPSERPDARFLGTLAHRIVCEWHRRGGDIGKIVDELWDREMQRSGLAETHETLLNRAAMKRNLRLYALHGPAAAGWRVEPEMELSLRVAGVEVVGRADRVDISPDRQCAVYDFKYSRADSVRQQAQQQQEGLAVQGGLYARALELEGYVPAKIQLVSLRDSIRLAGPDTLEESQELMQTAVQASEIAVEEIFSGRIEVKPADESLCAWCSFRDACRLQEAAAAALAAAGGQSEEDA